MTRWRRSPSIRACAGVRGGLGFLAAVAVHEPRAVRDRWPRARAGRACSCAPLLGGVAVSPPLICDQEHIDLLAEAIRAGLDDVAAL